jgi:NDP-sugar pyrophosphorylase family protein
MYSISLAAERRMSPPVAAILAGGKGTRLRPCVFDRPKVLAEVRRRYFLCFLLDQLADSGFNSVILLTGYMGDQIRESFGESYRSMELRYCREDRPLDTAGAVRGALHLLDSDPVLVMNGDSYCEADLRSFIDWHLEMGSEVSMLLSQFDYTARFGRVRMDGSGRVLAFEEKSSRCGPGWINAGIYLISRRVLETIPSGRPVSLEKEMFPEWTERRFFGYRNSGRFIDIGTPESYKAAQEFFEFKETV